MIARAIRTTIPRHDHDSSVATAVLQRYRLAPRAASMPLLVSVVCVSTLLPVVPDSGSAPYTFRKETPAMTAPVPATAVELREAQRIEYGTYVAVVPIDIGGARAFNVGDPVPVSHVENKVVASPRSPS
jgi:hypothetical protein